MIIISAFLGVIFDGVILEGAFNSARQEISFHPFIWVKLLLLIYGFYLLPIVAIHVQACICLLFKVLLEISRHRDLFSEAMG